ncbi:MAG: aconitate hydratase [Planctomycetota bacterium]
MPLTVAQKILTEHLVEGAATPISPGSEVALRMDQTLTQDATGTTAFLLFEAMGAKRVRTELSVSYVDHNLAQFGPENHNDHLYLQSIAAKVGAFHSRPGNGICHQVHLERFASPGKTLLGSDSHTPTAGGMGMIAIGAGGLDVAMAMAGGAFYTTWPRVIGVELRGELGAWLSAKDIILRLLSILTTRGNVGSVVEYFGDGVGSLPVPARATCTNMGAELGVTTSIFPSDDVTRQFLDAQGRGEQFIRICADEGAQYDRVTKRLHAERDRKTIENIKRFCAEVDISQANSKESVEVSFSRVVVGLAELEPLAAATPSPDNVIPVAELAGAKVAQVVIGSCTNSSYEDLMRVAAVLKDRHVHPDVELAIAPGSRQVLSMLADNGALGDLVRAGARILEAGCGPCIGLGFSPAEGEVSLRTFNRNFPGRSGTKDDMVYLVSPATAVASALAGQIADPRELAEEMDLSYPDIESPDSFMIDDGMIQAPAPQPGAADAEVHRGPTMVKPPAGRALPDELAAVVLIKVADNVTTDHIMPAGGLLKYRSNVPEYSKHVFSCFNEKGKPTFAERAAKAGDAGKFGAVVAADSYGQGSSREHAALCPMYLGVGVVIAKTIERIHHANLVNFGILPLTFCRASDYDCLEQDDELAITGVRRAIKSGETVTVRNVTRDFEFACNVCLTPRQRKILAAGGLLNYTRRGGK